MPTNGLSLEQGIQLECAFTVQGFLTSSGVSGTPAFAGRSFALSDFSSVTNLTSVFDQYRFDQIEVWLDPHSVNGNSAWPDLYSAVDLDDGNNPTTVASVENRTGALIGNGIDGHYHKWVPHVAFAVYSGAFTSFASVPHTWIDCASSSVQHYGLKTAAVSNGSAIVYNLNVRAVISLKCPVIT